MKAPLRAFDRQQIPDPDLSAQPLCSSLKIAALEEHRSRVSIARVGYVQAGGSNDARKGALPLARQSPFEVGREEPCVGFVRVARDDLIVIDVQATEDALVELATHRVRGAQVVVLGAPQQGAKVVELLDDEVAIGFGLCQLSLGVCPGDADAVLLLLKLIDGDRVA